MRKFGIKYMVLKDGTERLSRNVVNYQSTLRNILKERRSYFLIQYKQIGLRNGDVIYGNKMPTRCNR